MRGINGYQDEPMGSVCGITAPLRRQLMSSQDNEKKRREMSNRRLDVLTEAGFSFLFFSLNPAGTFEQPVQRSQTPASAVQSFNPFSVLAQERSLNSEPPAGMVIPHAARNPGQVSIIWQETRREIVLGYSSAKTAARWHQRPRGLVTEVIKWPDKMRTMPPASKEGFHNKEGVSATFCSERETKRFRTEQAKMARHTSRCPNNEECPFWPLFQ